MCHENTQVEFDYGFGTTIIWNVMWVCSPEHHLLKLNLVYKAYYGIHVLLMTNVHEFTIQQSSHCWHVAVLQHLH